MVFLDDPEHFQAQSDCQRRFAPMVFAITGMVFGFPPECCSTSPESPKAEIRA
jgi:hypothetical protein